MEYKINTVQQMIDCTNKDNLDDFLIDFRNILEQAHKLRSVMLIYSEGFAWVDDGKHETQTIIEII